MGDCAASFRSYPVGGKDKAVLTRMNNLTVKNRLLFVTTAAALVLLVAGAVPFPVITRATDALQRMFEGRARPRASFR